MLIIWMSKKMFCGCKLPTISLVLSPHPSQSRLNVQNAPQTENLEIRSHVTSRVSLLQLRYARLDSLIPAVLHEFYFFLRLFSK